MILTSRFNELHNRRLTSVKVHCSYYTVEDDCQAYIPSLGYDLADERRHFDVDMSGLTFIEPDDFNEANALYLYTANGVDYETYDDLPSAIGDMLASTHSNAHVVHVIAEKDNTGKITHVFLMIYWY